MLILMGFISENKNNPAANFWGFITENILWYRVMILPLMWYLLIFLYFFSHFLLYSHSCQWPVGTDECLQFPPAFTDPPTNIKQSFLSFLNSGLLRFSTQLPTNDYMSNIWFDDIFFRRYKYFAEHNVHTSSSQKREACKNKFCNRPHIWVRKPQRENKMNRFTWTCLESSDWDLA